MRVVSAQVAIVLLLAGPLGGQAVGPYTSNCTTTPLAAVDQFSSLFVTLEPTLIEDLANKCLGPLNAAAEKVSTYRFDRATLWTDASGAATSVSALKKVIASSEGVLTYLATCSGSAAWTNMTRSMPEVASLAALISTGGGLKEGVDEAKKISNALDRERRDRFTAEEWQKVWEIMNGFWEAKEDIGKLSDILNVAVDSARRPEVYYPATGELDALVSRARSSTAGTLQNCNVAMAEKDVKAATDRGQVLLLQARLARARAQKVERSYREGLERLFSNFQNNPLAQRDLSLGYPKWLEASRAMQRAERDQALLEGKLAEAGRVCGELQANVNQVYQMRNAYDQTRKRAEQQIQACQLNAAEASLQQLRRQEGGACKEFLANGVFEETRMGSNPFVPTGQVFGTPAERLTVSLVGAHRTCGVSSNLPGAAPRVEEIPDSALSKPKPGALAGKVEIPAGSREPGYAGSWKETKYTSTTMQVEVDIPQYKGTGYISNTKVNYAFSGVPQSVAPGQQYKIQATGSVKYEAKDPRPTDGAAFGSNVTVEGDATITGQGARRVRDHQYEAGEFVVTVKPNARSVTIRLNAANLGSIVWTYKN